MPQIIFLPHEEICPEGAVIEVDTGTTICDAALANGIDGGNGVYQYGPSSYPANSYNASNYWVDVVFDISATDTLPPSVVTRVPAAGANGVATTTAVTRTQASGRCRR